MLSAGDTYFGFGVITSRIFMSCSFAVGHIVSAGRGAYRRVRLAHGPSFSGTAPRTSGGFPLTNVIGETCHPVGASSKPFADPPRPNRIIESMVVRPRGILIATALAALVVFAVVQDRVTAAGARRYVALQR